MFPLIPISSLIKRCKILTFSTRKEHILFERLTVMLITGCFVFFVFFLGGGGGLGGTLILLLT